MGWGAKGGLRPCCDALAGACRHTDIKGPPKEGVWHFQEARLRRQQKVRHHLGSRTAFDAIKRSAVPTPKNCVLKSSVGVFPSLGGSFRRFPSLSAAFRRFPRPFRAPLSVAPPGAPHTCFRVFACRTCSVARLRRSRLPSPRISILAPLSSHDAADNEHMLFEAKLQRERC